MLSLKYSFFVTLLLSAVLASGLSLWQLHKCQSDVSQQRTRLAHVYEEQIAVQSGIALQNAEAARSAAVKSHNRTLDQDCATTIQQLKDNLIEGRKVVEKCHAAYYRALLARDRQFIWVLLGFSSLIAAIATIPIYFIPQSRAAARRLSLELTLLNAQVEISRILSEGQSEAVTLQNVTKSLCNNLLWDCGCFWSFEESDHLLKKSYFGAVQHEFQIEPCLCCVLKPGQGLPGRAGASRMPEWVEAFDGVRDRVCPCASSSAALGVTSAVAFPLFHEGEVLGVFELCSNTKREKDEQMIKLLVSVTAQVGQFLGKQKAQARVVEFQRNLEIAFDQTFQFMTFLNPDGTILRANKTTLEFFNFTLPELAGKVFWECPWSAHSKETQLKIKNAVEAAADGNTQRFETDLSVSGVSVVADFSAKPVFDDKGRVYQVLVEGRNISESWQARAKLEQFAIIVESATEAIISCNLEGIVQTWNKGAENMLYFTAEEMIGKPISIIVPTNGSYEMRKISRVLRRGTIVRNYEMQYRRKDGSDLDVSVSFAPLRDESGKVVAGSSVAQDISARKEAEKRVREFYSTVSHELRTPLTSIHASLRLMECGLAGPLSDEVSTLIEIARSESDRLIRLINDILDLRKMEAGKLELKCDMVPVSTLIDRAIKAMKGMAERAQVTLESDTTYDNSICCDQDRILQVLENLLSNAIKFSPANSAVTLSATGNGHLIKFSVKDDGCGIPKDQVYKLFTKFQQLDSSDARLRGGTGLGLAISKEIVERHHGQIGIESEPGKGSLFWIELPAQTGAAQPPFISASAA